MLSMISFIGTKYNFGKINLYVMQQTTMRKFTHPNPNPLSLLNRLDSIGDGSYVARGYNLASPCNLN